ncbi:MAG: GNAT family N-acetyltransferase [Alphaproteobacteria bacterium]|nr:GNAT family N-acetyltransferase [Alphaproteobacteria bacterium]
MNIREMAASDTRALQQIYLDARVETFHWWPAGSFKLEDFEKSRVLVAELEGKMVGFSSSGDEHFLHNLFVAPAAQGKGIGKQLLAACFASKLNKPVRLKCTVRNTKACAFYEANGWEIEAANVANDPDPYHLYIFR